MPVRSIVLEYDSASELGKDEQELIRRAAESARLAYAPYSGFRVGAAVLLNNGQIIAGNNQENAAYPSGNCAERIALFYANSLYPGSAPQVLAITAINSEGEKYDHPVYPCGACRQVILESEIRFSVVHRLIFAGRGKIQVVNSVKDILPLFFDRNLLLSGK